VDSQGTWKLDGPIVWTPELVKRLEPSRNNIAWEIDHWIDRIIGGFITEFVIDSSSIYSEVEHKFFKGPRCKYLKSLKTWIKMLLCENRVMPLH